MFSCRNVYTGVHSRLSGTAPNEKFPDCLRWVNGPTNSGPCVPCAGAAGTSCRQLGGPTSRSSPSQLWRPEGSDIKALAGPAPAHTSGGEPFPAPRQFLVAPGSPWPVATSPRPPRVFSRPLPSASGKDASHVGLGLPSDLLFRWLHLRRLSK